jgi:hypothetical protein
VADIPIAFNVRFYFHDEQPTHTNRQGNGISDLREEIGEEGGAPSGSFDFAAV